MRIINRSAVALVTAYSLFPSSAGATITLQAASGHPHLTSGTASWTSEWSTGTTFDIVDGRAIHTAVANQVWDTPIPITATGVNWNTIAFGGGSNMTNRICAFTNQGNFSNCGASVIVDTTGQNMSTVFVPSNGSAYSQTSFAGGGFLYHMNAF